MGEKVDRIRRGIAKNQLKPVIELDQNGNVINEWECISDVAEEFGLSPSAIGQALKKGSCVKGRIIKNKAQ